MSRAFMTCFLLKVKKRRKNFYFPTIPKIFQKVKILKRGLLDENIDVIHYAATELNKVDTEIQKKINISEKSGKRGK